MRDDTTSTNRKPFIMVVEDEEAIADMIGYNLEREGYKHKIVGDGEEAVIAAKEKHPDLILLDWMLPSMSGIDVCRNLRKNRATRNIPIIMLTAKDEESDVLMGLESGADDYVTKPFSPSQLIARIQAVLRRIRPALSQIILTFEGIKLDQAMQRVTYKDNDISLGPTEFRILRHFMEHPEFVFSREQLLDAVWGHDIYVEIRTVDVHIRRLRKALNEIEQGLGDLIHTIRSAGYAIKKPENTKVQ